MARVRPFAAYRYARPRARHLSADRPSLRRHLARAARRAARRATRTTSSRSSCPRGPLDPTLPGNRYETGADDVGRLAPSRACSSQDDAPAVYVLEQRFTRDGVTRTPPRVHRRGRTRAVLGGRRAAARAHAAQGARRPLRAHPGHRRQPEPGLRPVRRSAAARPTRSSTRSPPASRSPHAIDADGVESTLWAGERPRASPASLADAPRRHAASSSPTATTATPPRSPTATCARAGGRGADAATDPAYDFVMMALVNMDDPELVVMPTHRVADAAGAFDADAFWAALAEHFDVARRARRASHGRALEDSGRPAFLGQDAPRRRAPRVDPCSRRRRHRRGDPARPLSGVEAARRRGAPGARPRPAARHPPRPPRDARAALGFVKDADAALAAAGEHDVVFVLRPTRMDQLRAVALAGETMPQKSTYFYPKLLSGLVFRSAE